MHRRLNWPLEASQPGYANDFGWHQGGSNLCLDFHGDPLAAKLVVFSDGNHHMALEACCRAFLKHYPDVVDIFYATTPPRVILESVLNAGLMLGNLHLNVMPQVFISPKNILDKLITENRLTSHQAFARSRGNVLLVKKGNPKSITSIADCLRDDVRLTLSNPVTESASYEVYKKALLLSAEEQGLDIQAFADLIAHDSKRVIFGESIHHREVPQTLYANHADVAIVYYHLGLRYTRIFPDEFEFIEIKTRTPVTTDYHLGLMNNPGKWGQSFLNFILSDAAQCIYQEHGLEKITL